MKAILETLIATGGNTTLLNTMNTYATAQTKVQQIGNPSGTCESSLVDFRALSDPSKFADRTGGLGEPKFYVNETAFLGSWGETCFEEAAEGGQ